MSVSTMLDLSLEEIIKSRKKQGGGGGGGGGGRARGGGRSGGGGRGGSRGSGGGGGRPRGGRAVTNTTSARIRKNANAMEIDSQPKGSSDGQWKHDLFDGGAQGRGEKSARVVIQTGAKLTISNLAYDVLGNDLKDIFKQYGEVKSTEVFFDKTDRSTGEAEVVFANRADAQKAARELDGALVNNQAISVKFVGTNVVKKVGGGGATSSNGSDGSLRISATKDGSQRIVVAVGGGASTSSGSGGGRRSRGGGGFRVASTVSTPAGITKGSSSSSSSGSGSGGRRRGRRGGQGRERSAPPTKEDLDAEMEDYHQSAE